jgi:two-component system sensor histidine kinase EvgS
MTERAMWRCITAIALCLAGCLPGVASAQENLSLSNEEVAWIQQHPVVRVSVLGELEPIEYLRDGQLHGLSAEFLKIVTRKTGLRFTYLSAPTSQDRVAMLERGEADLISAMRVNGEVALSSDLLHTPPYHVSAGIVVTRVKKPFLFEPDQLNGMTVTLPYLQRYSDELRQRAPHATLIQGGAARTMLQQVADGTADVAIGTEGYLIPYLYREFQGQLQIAGVMPGMTTEIGMSVSPGQPVLFSIVRKTLASITPDEIRSVHENWLSQHMHDAPSFSDVIEHFWHQVVLAGLVLILLSAVAALTYRMRQKAVRNEREKTMFLAVMSHEIRSPMNSVLASVELLRNTPLDKQQQHFADLANRGAHSILTLIDDVLDVTKMEAGQVKLELDPVNIATLVRNVVDLHQLRARERHLSLTYEGDPEPPLLMLDDTRLGQVLNNLVSNAIKFTELGGVTLRYVISPGDTPERRTLQISVIDTGIGIPKDVQARLFVPYAQAARSFKRSGGSGLGLAISRDIVSLMEGSIKLSSAPDEGTVIDVELPARLAPEGAVVSEPSTPRFDDARPATALRILVVEDTPANQMVMKAQLEGFGCTAVLAQDGAQALACFSQGVYDLVLMDCDLPDQTGYALTVKLRLMERDGGQARCPILAISASTGAEHTARCFESGMDGILSKPIRLGKLQSAVELWCGVTLTAIQAPPDVQGLFGSEQIIEALRQDLRHLLEAVALQDSDSARRSAHRLRGASLTVEWKDVADATGAIEALFVAGVKWSDPLLVDALQELVRRFDTKRSA